MTASGSGEIVAACAAPGTASTQAIAQLAIEPQVLRDTFVLLTGYPTIGPYGPRPSERNAPPDRLRRGAGPLAVGGAMPGRADARPGSAVLHPPE